jgi:hypothetical protein
MKNLIIVALLVMSVGGLAAASASKGDPIWIPMLNPPPIGATWAAAAGNTPWSGTYAKQYDQTGFKLCGYVEGTGDVLLTYADAGDAYNVAFAQPTAECYETYVGYGSNGSYAMKMNVHMNGNVVIHDPQIFIRQER